MNYARYFYTEYFPDLRGSVLHVDDDCVVQGKPLILMLLASLVVFKFLSNPMWKMWKHLL